VSRRGNGIHLWNSVENTIRDNRIAGVRDGVYLSFAHRNLITGNQGTRLRYGIHYMYSERNRLIGNRFSECIGGIALMFSMGNHIEGNRTAGNRDFGILCQQIERSSFLRNRSERNGRGFYIENSARNELMENWLSENGVGVYLTAGSEQNTFSANRFDRNLVQIYRDHAGANRWSKSGRGNFWSDYVGVDWDRDGIGDTPYRLETAASALMARRPEARWFWMSPVMTLADWWEGRWLRPAADSLDLYPMVGGSRQ
jgi:nitrous oxidase accessory protein